MISMPNPCGMICPGCGARFERTEEDDTEFDEEMREDEDWDEE